ncbi:TonB-dependent receptor [Desulfosarcina sp.]|uniref:TonB-dependent receptor n=1 Tax=Desulfosarcina sp. TaxID=2027861 RepID=UPI0035623D49
MKSSSIFFALLALFVTLVVSNPVTAQEPLPAHELDQVSVTATRIERKTAEVPASVAVVGNKAIQETPMSNIKEVIRGIPGVLIDTRNQGYDSRIIIRGAGLKARYGVRDIMVLLDGVPITDPDGLTRLDFIDTQLIDQVEVVKGPNSTLWGANAAGGVINMTTKSPFEREGGVAKVGVGDYDTRNYHLSYSDDIAETVYYTLSGSRRESDNSWRRWNEFETNQASLQGAMMLDDGSTVESYVGVTSADIQLPGKLNESQFATYQATGKALETDGPWQYSGRYSDIFFVNAKYTKELGPWEFKPVLYLNKWAHEHPITGRINDADTNTFGADLQLNRNHRLAGMKGILTFGATGRWDDQETDYYRYADFATTPGGRITEVLSDQKGELIETQDRRVDLYGFYVQESLRPTDRWIVDMGLRYDDIQMDITGTRTEEYSYSLGRYVPAEDPVDVRKNFSGFSPRIGLTYLILEWLNLYTNFSQGIQTPTEGEISENPDLNPVTVQNYELGLKARARSWMFDSAVYYSPVEDEVVQVIGSGGDSQYVNSGETLKQGFEFSGAWSAPWQTLKGLEFGAGYSYTNYTFEDFSEPVRAGAAVVNMDRSGNTLPFIPRHQYSLYGRYRHASGLKFKLETFSWGSYYVDNANTEKYEGYDFVTNAMVGYEKGPFQVTLNVDNLFDKYYAVEVEKDTQGVKRYTPAAPRSFIVRLAYHF